VIEVTSELGIKNQVTMRCGNDTGGVGESAEVNRRQLEPIQNTSSATGRPDLARVAPITTATSLPTW
jgi:hypothetical protein